jgi:hypothetical protein
MPKMSMYPSATPGKQNDGGKMILVSPMILPSMILRVLQFLQSSRLLDLGASHQQESET